MLSELWAMCDPQETITCVPPKHWVGVPGQVVKEECGLKCPQKLRHCVAGPNAIPHSMKRHAYVKIRCENKPYLTRKCFNTVFRFAQGEQNAGFGSKVPLAQTTQEQVRGMGLYCTLEGKILCTNT